MSDVTDELNLSELDDGYLKVLLLLAGRRASTTEPRRAGFGMGWPGSSAPSRSNAKRWRRLQAANRQACNPAGWTSSKPFWTSCDVT